MIRDINSYILNFLFCFINLLLASFLCYFPAHKWRLGHHWNDMRWSEQAYRRRERVAPYFKERQDRGCNNDNCQRFIRTSQCICTHVGYSEYTADIQVNKEQDLALGTMIMFTENTEINEVVVAASRNVFTTDKQLIYPYNQQFETSGGGLDLLQKLSLLFFCFSLLPRDL